MVGGKEDIVDKIVGVLLSCTGDIVDKAVGTLVGVIVGLSVI